MIEYNAHTLLRSLGLHEGMTVYSIIRNGSIILQRTVFLCKPVVIPHFTYTTPI